MEWHEDLKKVLKMAGEANKKVVFLFADTQIKQESFVEDISNLLNTYEVPNLLQPADLATTFENIRPRAKAAGMDGNKDQLYSFFLQEVGPCLLLEPKVSLLRLLTVALCTKAVICTASMCEEEPLAVQDHPCSTPHMRLLKQQAYAASFVWKKFLEHLPWSTLQIDSVQHAVST